MLLELINFKGETYPIHEAEGNAAQWIIPLAKRYCKGKGFDIGYSKEAWMLPGAIGIEPTIDAQWDAMRLPDMKVDFIFSSHCLEHVRENWYNVIDYWLTKLRDGGIMFLYLPHKSQLYWHPSSNRKHIHSFDGTEILDYLHSLGHKTILGGCDANHSFVVICEKIDTNKNPYPIGSINHTRYEHGCCEVEKI